MTRLQHERAHPHTVLDSLSPWRGEGLGENSPNHSRTEPPNQKRTFNIQLPTFSERTNRKPWALNVECWLLNVFRVHGKGWRREICTRFYKALRTSCSLLVFCGVLLGCGRKESDQTEVVRPVKSKVVGSLQTEVERNFPGRVIADLRVTLSFEVGGTIIERPFRVGEHVTNGAVLARLDPRDYQNALDAAKAELERARAQFDRVEFASKYNAVSQQDLSNARAAVDVAQAQVNIRQKALDDTVLKAPFDGEIADRFVDENQFIQPREPILNFQDVSDVDIQVFVPEAMIVTMPRKELGMPQKELQVEAVFDSLPNVVFPVTFRELSTEADPVTQTYRFVLTMPSPKEYSILPGMGGTIRVRVKAPADVTNEGFRLPLDAVPVDSATGKYSVWILKATGDGLATAHMQTVEVGSVMGNSILVRSGLTTNDRIALAGVHVLKEGQTVRPFDATNNPEPK